MSVDPSRLAAWLRCPVCHADLEPVERLTLGCVNGHRHDVNKRGYVVLLGGGTKHLGDTAEMLDARDLVLESGAYSPIADAVAASATGTRVLDAGAGTGHYLRAALSALPDARGLAMDLSPQAVARAARSSERMDGLVADTWRPLPVRSEAADTVLDVFAPRNLPEFHRVLRPEGTLVVVVPRADHLGSLRAAGTMLDIPSDKADGVIAATEPLYALLAREPVAYDLALTPALRDALAGMGPSARHAATGAAAIPSDVDATRVSVDVLRFARR
ncbi:methyltransferase domain-containing protein [Leifsonia sp. 1010]|uniref:methyltransferase domain-containing protein n=1 Tax=Leifsonia sp. 1010 TaxID=2817769 RepID=UPI002854293A|nr:methyltransferase domain-containing protein [Leifsonia sp. 1010]MDR6613637.1 23S rRNA (guanine745-N1)-methyltransferase [Leifsonia sp. 1010]